MEGQATVVIERKESRLTDFLKKNRNILGLTGVLIF